MFLAKRIFFLACKPTKPFTFRLPLLNILFSFCIQIVFSFHISSIYDFTSLNCCGDSFVLQHRAFSFRPRRFIFLCDSLPPALHFVVLSSHKVPLDTSAAELCNFSHQGNICNHAEELILTRFLLIYYPSSQVLPQTFITLASTRRRYDTDKMLFFF